MLIDELWRFSRVFNAFHCIDNDASPMVKCALRQVNLSSSQCVTRLKNIGKMSLTQMMMAHSVCNDNVVPPNCSLYLKNNLGFSQEYVWVCSVSVEPNVSCSGKWHKRHICDYFSSGSITITSSCQSKLDIWDMYSCWKWILASISVFHWYLFYYLIN